MSDDFELIDISEVPERCAGRKPLADWLKVFQKIPRGKALVLPIDKWKPSTVRSALYKLQKANLISNNFYYTLRVKLGKGWVVRGNREAT